MERYRSGQTGQTVNLLAFAFQGSNPCLPTMKNRSPQGICFSCAGDKRIRTGKGRKREFLITEESSRKTRRFSWEEHRDDANPCLPTIKILAAKRVFLFIYPHFLRHADSPRPIPSMRSFIACNLGRSSDAMRNASYNRRASSRRPS